MTAAALTPSVEYIEDGVTLLFPAPFRFLAATHLEVKRITAAGVVTTLAHGSAWSATGGTSDAGGTVTLVASVAGSKLKIRRITPRSQQVDYQTNDTFPAETHETALDRLTLTDQEQDVKIADTAIRSLQVPEGETAPVLPAAADRANKYLVGDADGNISLSSGTGADAGLRVDLADFDGAKIVGGLVATHFGAGATGADQSAAIQAKLDAVGPQGTVKIKGVARIVSGLVLAAGQRLIGESGGWFVNTNSGTTWAGQNTGTLPQSAFFFDAATGTAVTLGEGAEISDLHIYGQGYTGGAVDIQKPNPPTQAPVTGVVKTEFATLRNVSIYYFQTGVHSTDGDFYSRHYNVEITRCTVGEKFDLAAFNVQRFGCTMRVVEKPYEFAASAELHLTGCSIEGYSQTIDLPAGSLVSLTDCYFETFNDLATLTSLWKATGSNVTFSIGGTRIYMNHTARFFDANGRANLSVTDRGGNQIINGTGSNNAVGVLFFLPVTLQGGKFNLGGGSQIINYDDETRDSTTGGVTAGAKALVVASAIVEAGQRIRIIGAGAAGADLITLATAVVGTAVTLKDAASTTVAGTVVDTYSTVNYVQHTLGSGLIDHNQKMTVAAMQMADMKAWAQRS